MMHSKLTRRFFLPDVCKWILSDVRNRTLFVHENFFSLKYDKFAVKCYSNSKITQNAQNLGFPEKIESFLYFLKKPQMKKPEIFQNRYSWQICWRMHIK